MTSNNLRRCKPMLGTYVEISLSGNVEDLELIQLSEAMYYQIAMIESKMSFHNKASELSKMNICAHQAPQNVSKDMVSVLNQALELSRLSNGIFDVTVGGSLVRKNLLPDHQFQWLSGASYRDIIIEEEWVKFEKPLQVDLGGIAKGYAIDCAIALCPKNIDAVINAGGDIVMNQWHQKTIAIRSPSDPSMTSQTLVMKNCAVATSGCYFYGEESAIIFPEGLTGTVKKGSVSIFANNGMIADALTKISLLSSNKDVLTFFDAQEVYIPC